ncbi:MAG: putative glycoside hydrolase [Candidatus Paceibacterota bacterium]|jgi:hypothetical protein
MSFWKDNGATRILVILIGACFIVAVGILIVWLIPLGKIVYPNQSALAIQTGIIEIPQQATSTPQFVVTHVPTPKYLKAVYMTSWAAGNNKFRKELFDLVDTTEINAVVIDVKDYSGRISFAVDDPFLQKIGSSEKRIPDIKEFIGKLHEKGVYVIGRISSFQDSFLINVHPEWAVKSTDGNIWKDYKSVKWLDPGAVPVWDYLVAIGKQSYAYGFDELNFDYIRYPSDGNMKDIVYSWSNGRTRREVMRLFFLYLRESFVDIEVPLSVDLFGLTTSAVDDLGIGQHLDDALPYFDYVSPMVYPSHFGTGYIGLTKPAEYPYEVVKNSMDQAVIRAIAASTSPEKIRPWLQAFDLGAVYTPAMVRKQIQATYDAGLTSWMLWNAGSVYNKGALLDK